MRRDLGGEFLTALIVIGVLALALIFGLLLTISQNGGDLPATETRVAQELTIAAFAASVTREGRTFTPTPLPESPTAVPVAGEQSATPTAAPSDTVTPEPSETPAPSLTPTPQPSFTPTPAPSATPTEKPTSKPTEPPTRTPTAQETAQDAGGSRTASRTPRPSNTAANTARSSTATFTASVRPSATSTVTSTASLTASFTPSRTFTATASITPSPRPSATPTFTATSTASFTATHKPSNTPSVTPRPSNTPRPTLTPTLTATATEAGVTVIIATLPPSATPDPAQPTTCPPPPANWLPYVVQRGDTLSGLALRAGISIAALQAANCFGPESRLLAGQTLYLPPGAAIQPSPTAVEGQPTVSALLPGINQRNCANPQAVIFSPQPGITVRGSLPIIGAAYIPNFSFYKLEIQREEGGEWINLRTSPIALESGILGQLDTNLFETGIYWLQLTVVDQTSSYPAPCAVRLAFSR